MARRKANLVYQAETAIKMINFIGESKRGFRANNQHGLHSYKQVRETISVVMNFVKWLKERKVKSIYKLTEEDYIEYIKFKKDEGVLNGHLINIETALRHLDKGMNKVSESLDRKPVIWIPKTRMISSVKREDPRDRSYTNEEIQTILLHCSKNVQLGILLALNLGLRAKEVIYLKVDHVDLARFEIVFTEQSAKGVTKGGRYRIIPIPPSFIEILASLVKDKNEDDYVLGLKNQSSLRDGLSRACRKAGLVSKGMHGFRHTYSRNRIHNLFIEKRIEEPGYKMLRRIFNNLSANRKADYGILSEKDKSLYKLVKNCIDIVHSELGHGRDRWDLAKVYMSKKEYSD